MTNKNICMLLLIMMLFLCGITVIAIDPVNNDKQILSCDNLINVQNQDLTQEYLMKIEGKSSWRYSGDNVVIFEAVFDPINLIAYKNGYLKLWIYVEDIKKLGRDGQIEISSKSCDVEEYNWSVQKYIKKAGWQEIALPFNNAGTCIGSPDFSKICYMRIYSLEQNTTFLIDDIRVSNSSTVRELSYEPLRSFNTKPVLVDSLYDNNEPVYANIIITKAPYNADNTGVKDSTYIIQQALNDCLYAGGGTVFIPAGIYKISDKITIPAFVFLRGDWQNPTVEANEYATLIKTKTSLISQLFYIKNSGGVFGLNVYADKTDEYKTYPFKHYIERQINPGEYDKLPDTGNVYLYDEALYNGNPVVLCEGEHIIDMKEINSIKVPAGTRVKLYRDQSKGGGFISFNDDEIDLSKSGWSENIIKAVVELDLMVTDSEVRDYNYILSSQQFDPFYSFTGANGVYEAALRMYEIGAKSFKTFYEKADIDEILKDMDFKYVYLWVRSEIFWNDGLSTSEAEEEYNAIYNITVDLLKKYNKSGIRFYMGHWEGDWYLIGGYDTDIVKIESKRLQGMIDWYNIRQKAIEAALSDIKHENVWVYQYAEANRVSDVDKNADRLINKVLPFINVDYVSYSSYDIQQLSEEEIKYWIDYISSKLKAKENVPGPRVFIGETSEPAFGFDYDQAIHNGYNLNNIIKFLRTNISQIFYWQIYDAALKENGISEGFCLIDNNNAKYKLYYSYKAFYCNAQEFVKNYKDLNHSVPSISVFCDWAANFLETLI